MRPVKVFLVDDSAVIRTVIARELHQRYGFEIVGTAVNGRDALRKIPAARPDVVVMDLEMPVVDGLRALQELIATNPVPVVILSAHTGAGSRFAVEALAQGAVDVVTKPARASELPAIVAELALKINAAAGASPRRAMEATAVRKAGVHPERTAKRRAELVVIGTSTGGPGALRLLLPALPAGFPAAVVVVQHMPPGFTASLAEHLNTMCALEVRHPEDNEPVTPGRILVAPSGKGFAFKPGRSGVRVRLTEEATPPAPGSFRPSVDAVMAQAAAVYGERCVGVLLTGMGRDGAAGMKAVRDAGGYTIAQDEGTCVVYGMPRAAVEAGAVQRVLPLAEIAAEIVQQV